MSFQKKQAKAEELTNSCYFCHSEFMDVIFKIISLSPNSQCMSEVKHNPEFQEAVALLLEEQDKKYFTLVMC